jgi:NitT/TauT family transport system substrate-binding protein
MEENSTHFALKDEKPALKLMTRRNFVHAASFAMAGAVLGIGMAGCSSDDAAKSAQSSSASGAQESPFTASDRELMGSADACTMKVGLMMGPPAMGLSKFMHDVQNGASTFNAFQIEVLETMDFSALAAYLNDGTYDAVTLPSNIGPIMHNNEDINTDVVCIALSNLGVLSIGTTDSSIQSLDDLKGKTLYCMGEGGTPGYTTEYIIEKAGLSIDVHLEYKSTPFELLNMVQDNPGSIAVLPHPFVEMAKAMTPGLLIPIDLTEEWNRLNGADAAQPVTTTTVVRRDFVEQHEQAVVEYLQQASQSVEYVLANVDEASQWQKDLGTFLNNGIAKEAIPNCSICLISGQEMQAALSGFLQMLYDMNPASVGGKMPSSDFYYLPPANVTLAQPGLPSV